MQQPKAVKVEMELKSHEQKWNITLSTAIVNMLAGYCYNIASPAEIMQDWIRYKKLNDVQFIHVHYTNFRYYLASNEMGEYYVWGSENQAGSGNGLF
jgi:hypothetical protein